MDLSLIIVSYNTKELLGNCLNSVKIASGKIKIEVFVVDNNSFDKSAEFVKKKFPWVKLIANRKNLGFSKANNQALKLARGKYVLILNPDTVLMPDTLKFMTSFMQKNQEATIATCKVELPNGQLDRDCRRHFPTPWRAFTHFSHLSKLFKGSKIFDQYYMGYFPLDSSHEIDSCVGAFMFIKKSLFKKIGVFDEDYFFYGEDLDLCWRAKKAGFKIYYTPSTKIIHYKGVSSGIKSHSSHLSKATIELKKNAIKESTRAMELFYRKHLLDKYPILFTHLVLIIVKILEKFRLFKITYLS